MSPPVRTEPTSPSEALAGLWRGCGLHEGALARVRLSGADPVLPSSFAVGTAAQVSIAAVGLAAAEIGRLRGGPEQTVSVEMRDAAVEFRSERWLRVNGGAAPELWDRIAGIYRCGDGRWVRIHTNFAHHRDGILELLQCSYEVAAVQQALLGWTAEGFEQAAAEAGLVVAALRSFEAWDAHPQGIAVAGLPLIEIEKIGEAPIEALGPADRPLGGVRVLDLTRIIAGPVCGRVLAAHGAEVLAVAGPHLPSIAPAVMDTGRGKRSCFLDLREETGRKALTGLARGADLFVEAYRPGGLAEKGFGAADLARLRPGIVHVSLSAYGHAGPWAGRRGFDSLVQTASGLNQAEAEAAGSDQPRALPAQVLDHAAGYFLALGALAALSRRTTEGGSWRVRVCLAGVARWLRGLGRVSGGMGTADLCFDDVQDRLETVDSGFGRLTVAQHAALLSHTPASWALPSVPLGTHPPRWAP